MKRVRAKFVYVTLAVFWAVGIFKFDNISERIKNFEIKIPNGINFFYGSREETAAQAPACRVFSRDEGDIFKAREHEDILFSSCGGFL